ncbi:TlpA disulfide reductase family protein [Bacteroides helcogenes]|uniref:Alkyl hydroperoxide reductase/ Thiol specific antioxidant/ Mal allergen n=1 Tax=Bacteroides helcogenes (strain ATCC 35417 / DSM 20613 / JCM 6297 / CCUG 15421 / P 36-108) TaxID=693979 RepID=E6SUL9_BACT6|nr:TlpA disulfide reductase family protein [Bacteroides helcogenes]ADV43383.1 alkyl hydroperoxide reductase/ Thiol specific antioxidant/ Mal allergen [Bacteroides helcogenes P 36-108]MDY5238151.1 TlpA disulfide reductase family protein [Bacteroides helcogenes]
MKKKHLLSVGIFLLALPFQAQEKCSIQGTVKGLPDGTVLTLSRKNGRVMENVAVDTVRNSTFLFNIEPANQQTERIMLMGKGDGFPNTWLDIYIAPRQSVKVSGSNKLLRTWIVESAIPEQQYQNQFINATRKDMDVQQSLQAVTCALWNRVDHSESADEKAALRDSIRNVLHPQTDSIQRLIVKEEIRIMKDMPINDAWIDRMETFSAFVSFGADFPYTEEVRALYQRMPSELRETEIGKQITTQLYPPKTVKVGDALVDADLFDLQGTIHHLSDYKGKYLLLDFWSYGCGPCRMAMPEMKEMAEAWKDDLVIVSISTDSKSLWEKASEAEKMTWVNVNDLKGTNGIYMHYGIRGIPHYVIISPEGKLLHVWSGYGQGIIRAKLKEWVKK